MLFSQIVIEARKGRGFAGDIAIDDIFYKSGTCGQAGLCLNLYTLYIFGTFSEWGFMLERP